MTADAARPPLLIALTCTLAELEAIERGLWREYLHGDSPATDAGHDLYRRVVAAITEARTEMGRPRRTGGDADAAP